MSQLLANEKQIEMVWKCMPILLVEMHARSTTPSHYYIDYTKAKTLWFLEIAIWLVLAYIQWFSRFGERSIGLLDRFSPNCVFFFFCSLSIQLIIEARFLKTAFAFFRMFACASLPSHYYIDKTKAYAPTGNNKWKPIGYCNLTGTKHHGEWCHKL